MPGIPNPAFSVWLCANPVAHAVVGCLVPGGALIGAWAGAEAGEYVPAVGLGIFAVGFSMFWWSRFTRLGASLFVIGLGMQDYSPRPEDMFLHNTSNPGLILNWIALTLGGIGLIWSLYEIIRDKRKLANNKED